MGHEGGFYLRSEYYYVHILLAISLNADSSEKLSFFFYTPAQIQSFRLSPLRFLG